MAKTKTQIIKQAQSNYASTKKKGLQQIAQAKTSKEKQAKQLQLKNTLDNIHATADKARGTTTYTVAATRPNATAKYAQVATKQPVQGAVPVKQFSPSLYRMGVQPTKAQTIENKKQVLKDVKSSAFVRANAGAFSGVSPVNIKYDSEVKKVLDKSKAL